MYKLSEQFLDNLARCFHGYPTKPKHTYGHRLWCHDCKKVFYDLPGNERRPVPIVCPHCGSGIIEDWYNTVPIDLPLSPRDTIPQYQQGLICSDDYKPKEVP